MASRSAIVQFCLKGFLSYLETLEVMTETLRKAEHPKDRCFFGCIQTAYRNTEVMQWASGFGFICLLKILWL